MALTAPTLPGTTAPSFGPAVGAGLIAGLVFLVWEMLLGALVEGSPWGPPRMIAAIVMGRGVLPPPASFDFGVVLVAMVVHFALSVAYALILAWIVERFDPGVAIAIGAVFGLVIYFVNFYGFTALFPWFATARNWISLLGHVLFGAVLAWAYKALASRAAPPTG